MSWYAVGAAGVSLVGGFIQSKGAKGASKDEASALIYQADKQDKLSRDVMQTGIEYANEQRDIGLGQGEIYRLSGATALAGMMDMTGLSRDTLELSGATAESESGPSNTANQIAGYNKSDGAEVYKSTDSDTYYRLGPSGEKIYTNKPGVGLTESPGQAVSPGGSQEGQQKGQSMYDAEYDYDVAGGIAGQNKAFTDAPEWELEADPGYQFRLDEGMRTYENSAAASGLLRSGGAARDLMAYGQNMASQEYQNIFNRLGQIAGFGTAASGGGNGVAGQSTINQAGSSLVESQGGYGAAGSALAQGKVGQANAWGNAFQGAARAVGWGGGGSGPSFIQSDYSNLRR